MQDLRCAKSGGATRRDVTVKIEDRRIFNELKGKRKLLEFWKLRSRNSGNYIIEARRPPAHNQLIQPPKPKSKNKAKFDNNNYYEKMPRHLYRCKKGLLDEFKSNKQIFLKFLYLDCLQSNIRDITFELNVFSTALNSSFAKYNYSRLIFCIYPQPYKFPGPIFIVGDGFISEVIFSLQKQFLKIK